MEVSKRSVDVQPSSEGLYIDAILRSPFGLQFQGTTAAILRSSEESWFHLQPCHCPGRRRIQSRSPCVPQARSQRWRGPVTSRTCRGGTGESSAAGGTCRKFVPCKRGFASVTWPDIYLKPSQANQDKKSTDCAVGYAGACPFLP